ncbi:MAG: hypothetical protein AAB685_03040, partial [Patescibacteria group bacterium]
MFRYAGSEEAYQGLAKEISKRPTYKLMKEAKLALTDMGSALADREEAFMSNWAEKIPGFGKIARASNRAYSGFLNKLRADTFDDILAKAKLAGVQETQGLISSAANFVNSATGRGSLGSLQGSYPLFNAIFFSPRLMASRINLLNPNFYMKLDPFVRKEALKSLVSFGALGTTAISLAKLGGANVGDDPRSADFGKIKIGNTRYDNWGGFQQYMVLATRLATGKMIDSTTGKEFDLSEGFGSQGRLGALARFFEFKTSPVASFALGQLRGKTAIGEEAKVAPEVLKRFIPMLAQDIFETYRERGIKGIPMATPAVFGVGTQSYGPKVPLIERTKFGQPVVKFKQPAGLAETIINKITGTEVSNIPPERRAAIL